MQKIRNASSSLPLRRLVLLCLILAFSVTFVNASSGDRLDVFVKCKQDWYLITFPRNSLIPCLASHPTAHQQTQHNLKMALFLSIYDYSYGIVHLSVITPVSDQSQTPFVNKISLSINSTVNGPSFDYGEFKNHVVSSFPYSIFTATIVGYDSSHNASPIHTL